MTAALSHDSITPITMKNPKALTLLVILLITTLTFSISYNAEPSELAEEAPKELAAYMTELQVLTHKLGLSIDAKNSQLIQLYLHESLVKVEEIQITLPEYEGVPVALLLDRLALPAYKVVRESYDAPAESDNYFKNINIAYNSLLNTCNTCHASSGREYIWISPNPANPYLQDFSPFK
jgi:hypothetical protein